MTKLYFQLGRNLHTSHAKLHLCQGRVKSENLAEYPTLMCFLDENEKGPPAGTPGKFLLYTHS
jgi:hypothetical protein